MSVETLSSSQKAEELTPPPDFKFDDDSMDSYEEQVAEAVARFKYQTAPLPSFEGVPTADVKVEFNPTGAPTEEVYARGRVPKAMRANGMGTRAEWTGNTEPITMWRIVDRAKLEDGTGLVASRIIQANGLGDVENFNPDKHILSSAADRESDPEAATPFVSFSTDPRNLAEDVILKHGFGIKGGRDSVVVQVKVDPNRVLTGPNNKEPEVLLLGGVAPEEYVAAYEVGDFLNVAAERQEIRTIGGEVIHRDQALGHWALINH